MLRNKAFTVLQKTYDDSYLSCSTAVYYESQVFIPQLRLHRLNPLANGEGAGQGNEPEAARHWKAALDNIYEHHAIKSAPGYEPQTDTERALVDALKQLELQCKERIDLLEALRVSLQDESPTSPNNHSGISEPKSEATGRTKGCIGLGTIPAVTYSQLSRPFLPTRPALPSRTTPENPVVTSGGVRLGLERNSSGNRPPRSMSPKAHSRREKASSPSSQEKRTMKTTLRSGRADDKALRPARKPPKCTSDGPSQAATLAWSNLGCRDQHFKTPLAAESEDSSATPPKVSPDQLSKISTPQHEWDSHSRRLIVPREPDYIPNRPQSAIIEGNSDDHRYSRPSLLSVSAASSALSSSWQQETPSSETQPASHSTLVRTIPALGPPALRLSRDVQRNDLVAPAESGEKGGRKLAADTVRRKAVARQPTQPAPPVIVGPHPSRTHRRRQRIPGRECLSSTSDDDVDLSKICELEKQGEPALAVNSQGVSPPGEDHSTGKPRERKMEYILNHLPPGVDEVAAKQILNDMVVHGDEVHWEDIAGLEIAKNALRETVVYPFLRPDLFMGLREPARGMLLFGPPGTGKTMLARAVATESKSTFFSISASSLTSKYLGESEKLVRALFGLARVLAPSIIFVDEIDSLLSQRSGSGEHEATRRIKTEFLIQWSDLQRAAAGREIKEGDKERGDANRVLVLAATNLPWSIDEAARRRFVRRQYIPLPEPHTRETQLRTLLSQQKHDLSSSDVTQLVAMTEGFSGSDITALAKDAAMGPLRSLGEALLHMTMDDIRPIMLADFKSSLGTIRPSVGKDGLKEYDEWAREFGERGG
ncbi:hypothetical protein RJ55_10074 [Drechmeria coniospora]|nr:hypothetical protein RJ55_10074 [Drechmeria coniospora]